MRTFATTVVAAAMAGTAAAHMSLISPFPRNSVDRLDPRFQKNPWWPYTPTCPKSEQVRDGRGRRVALELPQRVPRRPRPSPPLGLAQPHHSRLVLQDLIRPWPLRRNTRPTPTPRGGTRRSQAAASRTAPTVKLPPYVPTPPPTGAPRGSGWRRSVGRMTGAGLRWPPQAGAATVRTAPASATSASPACGSASHCMHCRSAAPPSPFSRRFDRTGEGMPAE